MDPISARFREMRWDFGDKDEVARVELASRIAAAGRRRSLVTYSELVKGVEFNLPNVRSGPPDIDMHPAEQLWHEHARLTNYPAGVLPVRTPIRGTSFFPGGLGLVVEEGQSLPAFPRGGTMVLGHDFHSEHGYNDSLERGFESPTQPTWRNLRTLLQAAQIPVASCFFTNFFMGLRAGSATTGTFPGAAHTEFVHECRDFLLRQLEAQQPTLVLTLGIHTPYYLAPLSPQLADWGTRRGLKHLDATGPVRFDVQFPALPSYSTTVVALTHPSLRHASVRHRSFEGLTGAEAELRMLAVALAERGSTSL